jgi:hypothetical protein
MGWLVVVMVAQQQSLDFSFGPDSSPNRASVTGMSRIANAFVEPDYQGKNGVRYAIHTDPGLTQFVDYSEDTVRGHFIIGSALYVVAGETLYKTSSGGAATALGTVAGSRPIIADVNRASPPQAAIVADANVYELQADVLLPFQDTDLPPGVHSVTYMNQRFIFGLQNGLFYVTGLNSTSVDALAFSEAEGRPDNGVRVISYSNRLFYFGTKTTELWSDSGASPFPYERDSNFIERGCLEGAKMSICVLDDALTFVDDRGKVCKFSGYSPVVISNNEVERDIQRTMTAQATDQIEAFVWATAGHEFYAISGPDWSWVYDTANQLWHEKFSYESERWQGRTYIRVFNKHLVGSNTTGVLMEMDFDTRTELGDHLIVETISPILGPWPASVIWDAVIVDMEFGVGDGTTDEHSGLPSAMLSWSSDGGASWSAERFHPLGPLGDRKRRMRFNRLGMSDWQGRMYKLRISAPVKRVIIEAKALVRVV